MNTKMRKYTGIALGALVGVMALSSCDNDNDDRGVNPPEEVKQVFAAQYPNMNAQWDFEWGNYEADFFYSGTHAEWNMPMNHVEAEAFYTSGAKWIKTEFNVTGYYYTTTDQTVIPVAVRETIAREAGGRHVDEVKIYDVPQGETDYYRVEVENEPNDIYFSIGFDGAVL